MGERLAAVCFLAIAAFIFVSKYICAAIYGSNAMYWDAETFEHLVQYVGTPFNVCSILALCIGVFYLLKAEVRIDWQKLKTMHEIEDERT